MDLRRRARRPFESMKIPSTLVLLAGIGLGAVVLPSRGTSGPPETKFDLEAFSAATSDLAKRVLAATVSLYVDKEEEEGPHGPGRIQGFGSGFVIDAIQGYVVTNHHVVGDVRSKVKVMLPDGMHVTGDVVAIDPQTDLAVVKIPEGSVRRQLPWGDSDVLKPGHLVMAVGSPKRVTGTTSIGVVSGINRNIELESVLYQDFIQFDAFIDRGSSGGPLVNTRGQVVGVNTAISGQLGWQGISYAVPSLMARGIVQDLIQHGKPRRGYLGVQVEAVTARYAEQLRLDRVYGVRVKKVTGEPAQKAGLQRGDVILAVNNRDIKGQGILSSRISTFPPGTQVKIKILREKTYMLLTATLGHRE